MKIKKLRTSEPKDLTELFKDNLDDSEDISYIRVKFAKKNKHKSKWNQLVSKNLTRND